MLPEPVTFPSSAKLIQDLFLARLIPKLRGCTITGLARSDKHTVKKEKLSADKLLCLTIDLCEFKF